METSSLLLLALIAAVFILYKLNARSSFWNVPGPQPRSFLLGNLQDLFQEQAGSAELEWQRIYGDVVRFKGSFGTEQLMVADPKALQHVLQGSGYKWRKSPVRREIARLTSGKGLAWADSDVHTRQRKVMLPGFREPETKYFVPYFVNCVEAMCSVWKDAINQSGDDSHVFNFPEYISRATLDAIGQTAFDYDFGSINNEENELANKYESLTANAFSSPPNAAILMLDLFRLVPSSVMEFVNNHNPKLKALHSVERVANNVASDLIAQKLEEIKQGVPNKDIMTFLVQSNLSENPKSRLTQEELLAQMRVLLFGGHETITLTQSWAFYELARNPTLQTRLRDEIRAAQEKISDRGDSEFSLRDYDEMPLLNAMTKETLRFYPVAMHLFRTSYEDDVLPLSKPIVGTDGQTISEIAVPKGTQVIGSCHAYHRNKEIFGEDAHEFNPDRWLEGRVKAETSLGVYANLVTFASGIRSCIGWRFAVAELQTFLVVVLKNFELEETPKLNKLRRESALGIVPTIEGEMDKGSQLPLRVRLVA